MADNDGFESSSDGTVSGYVYAQISVPSFTLDDVSETAVTSEAKTSDGTYGSSFLRLGSFPDVKQSSTYSSAFAASLTLAKLVGDTSTVSSVYASDDGGTVDSSSTGEHGTIGADNYKGDPDFLVGFMDDTRVRDFEGEELYIDGSSVPNTTQNRKKETKRLLTKGGWWEHTDGNRVTTTSGDKVEVVRGNYKLVILGRQDPANLDLSRVKIIDYSGGRDFSGTGSKDSTTTEDGLGYSKIQERLVDDKVWATYAFDTKKHVYKESSGVDVTVFTGSKKVTIVGDDPSGFGVRGPSENDPDIVSKTWASRIESYTGSADRLVETLYTFSNITEKRDFWYGMSYTVTRAAGLTMGLSVGPLLSDDTLFLLMFKAYFSFIFFYGLDAMSDSFEYKAGSVIKNLLNTTYVLVDDTEINATREDMSLTKGLLSNLAACITAKCIGLAYFSNKLCNADVKLVGTVKDDKVVSIRMIN